MKKISLLVCISVIVAACLNRPLRAQTVQAGIFTLNDTTLSVKAKPSASVSGLFSDVIFTIRWQDAYGVSLGNVTTSYGIAKQGTETTVLDNGITYRYQKFAGTNTPTINWNGGSEQELIQVGIHQTGSGTGTFELAPNGFVDNGDWYFELGGTGIANTEVPFYQASTAAALPIQMASFAANLVRDKEVEVVWRTVSETNNYGFEVCRKRGEAGTWTKMGFVEGHGTTLSPQSYSYTDRSVAFGKYFYRIKQIDLDGKSETFPEMEVNVGVGPGKFVVTQNYPNPFNPSTNIDFTVPQNGFTSLKVYNVLGQEVATLFEGNAETGKVYTARFNASSLASGLYFYRLRSAGKLETRRMLLLK